MSFVMVFLVFLFVYLGAVLFDEIGKPQGIGWVIFAIMSVIWIGLFIPAIRFMHGRLIEIGMINFSYLGIELSGFKNQLIPFEDIIYLSSDYERPQTQWQRHPPAKTYLIEIITKSNVRHKFIAARLSNNLLNKRNIIDVLQSLRKQNHDLYKALRGVKRDFGES